MHFATYDFEFVKKMTGITGEQIPYMFGIYTFIDGEEYYTTFNYKVNGNIYEQFVDGLYDMACDICPFIEKPKKCMTINLYGFNSFKADYPLIVK